MVAEMTAKRQPNTAVARENIRQVRYISLMKLRRFDEAAVYAEPDPAVIAEIVAINGPEVAERILDRANRNDRWVRRALRIRRFLPFLQ